MTTPAAAALYEAQHNYAMEGKRNAVYNPLGKPIDELPTIFGFNNGKVGFSFYSAELVAEDGTMLGGHFCSGESYMRADLGILEGTRQDRHEDFKKHYPDGYKMEFVGSANTKNHSELNKAIELAHKKYGKQN